MTIQYVGSKRDYAEDILGVILPGNEERPYYEPFVGSAAMLVKVPVSMKRFANDRNPYLIAMHEAVRDGWVPPNEISEEEYESMKRSPDKFPKELVGFAAFACSFGGTMFGTYARNAKKTNYAAQGVKAVLKTKEALQGTVFTALNFTELEVAEGSLVYCDPPYQGAWGYGNYVINYFGEFKTWCSYLAKRGCQVFISGYPRNRLQDGNLCGAKM